MIPPAAVIYGCSHVLLSCFPYAFAVRVSLPSPLPPLRSLHPPPLLIPRRPCRSTRRFYLRSLPCLLLPRGTPPAPLLLTWVVFFPLSLCRPRSRATSVVVAGIALFAAPIASLVNPPSSLFLPPIPPPPPTLGLLWPLTPSCAPHVPLPPAQAANFACNYKDFGNQTGGSGARWSVVGDSAPCRKCPSSPLAVVGDSKIWHLFLHRPQK